MNVLITSASRKVTLVKYFQNALMSEGGGKVVAVDISPLAPALYFADDHYIIPRTDNSNFVEVMLRLCRDKKIKAIIPTRDEELLLFACHKRQFAKIGTFVMVPEPETVRICQDKKRFVVFCSENGFHHPRLVEPNNIKTEDFPIFVRPRYGKGSKNTARADSFEDLKHCLRNIENPVVQEYVNEPEYTIDLFADLEGRVISVVPRQRVYVFCGESFITRTAKDPRIIEESRKLAGELKLIGHNTIQCFFDGNLVRFIEVNPRFGGAAHISFAAGAPSPLFLVKLLKGRTIHPVEDFKDNYIMLRYTNDMFLTEPELTRKSYS